jgi:hypothetical protein
LLAVLIAVAIDLGVGYQINSEFALGMRADMVGLGTGGRDKMPIGSGVGIKGSYYFSRAGEGVFLSTNVVNIEASYLLATSEEGRSAELTIGHDSIKGRGFGVLWSKGVFL